MTGISEQIVAKLHNLPKKLEIAAKFALDNPDRMAFGSMRSVAGQCGVSSPTMLRLARYLGYESYDDLKALFQSELASNSFSNRAERLFRGGTTGDENPLISQLQAAAIENINAGFLQNSFETLEAIAEVIRVSNTTHIVATGSMAWVAGHLENTGSIAFSGLRATRPGVASAIETLGVLDKNDAVLGIAIAPYAKTAIEAVQYAREIGVTTISITDRRSSPLAALSDYCLIARTESPHYYSSIVSVCALVEAILAIAVANSSGHAVKRIEKVVSLRQRSGSYID
ncbi:hypothetical protein WH96_05340 [Kiloniella spongiae]|uniref:RpiR family transcriptional regulator n=1 Tax=Kiloniella spongiae TaxID=1489064 RepID=A0A0H2MHR4_9PROT|nr:MurR/RpiR family transcriptional regulator [Kiloniella spongiae]KLN61731.1 hypothetical protein WH96_05340 [Kiloniella spongiae]